MIYIHLNKKMEKQLDCLAKKTQKTQMFHIKKAISEYLRMNGMVQQDLFRDKGLPFFDVLEPQVTKVLFSLLGLVSLIFSFIFNLLEACFCIVSFSDFSRASQRKLWSSKENSFVEKMYRRA